MKKQITGLAQTDSKDWRLESVVSLRDKHIDAASPASIMFSGMDQDTCH